MVYIAGLAARFDCPVTLVVIAPDRGVARWCARAIDLGHGRCVLRPWVLGPDEIPAITDPHRARSAPELAVFSLAVHAHDPDAPRIAFAALAASHGLDHNRGIPYTDVILALLSPAARAALEKIMATSPRPKFYSDVFRNLYAKGEAEGLAKGLAKGKAEGLAEGQARGEAKGKAEVLLKLLALRGIKLPAAQRKRILACTDHATLDIWAERVLTATSLREVLGDPP